MTFLHSLNFIDPALIIIMYVNVRIIMCVRAPAAIITDYIDITRQGACTHTYVHSKKLVIADN